MSSEIAICGMGLVSACGKDVKSNLDALLHQQTGIKKLNLPISNFHNKFYAGQVEDVPCSQDILRAVQLSELALKEAVVQAQLTLTEKIALVSSNTIGSMDYSETKIPEWSNSLNPTYRDLEQYDSGKVCDKLADKYGISQRYNISTACSSAANAFIFGAGLLKSGRADVVIVGGVDGLTRFTINGFNTLKIYDEALCKPFSENRSGLNLGEAAAYIVMKRADEVSSDQILAYFAGGANANDAYHQTASSPEGRGATLAMQNALKNAGVGPESIDYINAHGTATPNNDASEYMAFENVFGTNIPDYSSTKGYTGHTLAAAGGVEAVFSVLALQHQICWPNLNFDQAMVGVKQLPLTDIKKKQLHYVLSNSFGFGGNNTSLIFKRYVS